MQADAATDEVYARLALVAEDKVSVALQSIRTSLLLAVGAICSIDFSPCSFYSLHFATALQRYHESIFLVMK